ncbi:NADH-quinone oxidoreductase subunit C [Candidatus Desulforudis audaxviator]|uniref:Hydrogenase subunit, putative n=1 Tax=Desulforudis audaxviator (strain MP104C) TaxID=477974 RepID=B1I3Q4_DESAP|nr:NADH-quinone oxidoreductase subunit C [Candidatus Desulforudis audaxviator]ACA59612.1 hydrogenase subunit, putative [Candidatus Desulforudis audaxviator MP104C]AZK59601.1 Energy-conserving hydrogenase (ferredoxin), subunit D [Candidatus Desulforudis audaxviator]
MDTITVGKAELGFAVQRLLDENSRLVTAVCLDQEEHFVVKYFFHKDPDLVCLAVKVGKDEELPGISGLHLNAALIENEMKEFFGINITGIALDFGGRLLLCEDSPRAPLLKTQPETQTEG